MVSVVVAKAIKTGTLPIWMAIILGIIVCMLLALFNGVMSRILKSHTMIVSLGTMAVFQGLSYMISESKTFNALPVEYMYIGQGRIWGWLPLKRRHYAGHCAADWLFAAENLSGPSHVRCGRQSGSCPTGRPERPGISSMLPISPPVLWSALLRFCCQPASGSADSTMGPDLTFTGITACVLAGVALKGGEGILWKVIVAVFVLGVLSNGMQLIGLGTYPQYIAKGVIMLVSIYMSNRSLKIA